MRSLIGLTTLLFLSATGFSQTTGQPGDSCSFYVPNILTLSCDMREPSYTLRICSNCRFSDYHLRVYDKWGELLFESYDPAETWYAGDQSDGVYMWIIAGTWPGGSPIEARGSVAVLKWNGSLR